MGDRCVMKVTCYEADVQKFIDIWFKYDGPVETKRPLGECRSVVELIDHERTPNMIEMPKVPYFGWHGDGACYPGHLFVSDGMFYYEVIDVADVGMCVPVDKNGNVSQRDASNVRKYTDCLKHVKEAFGIKE